MSKVLNRCKAGPMVQEHDLDPRTRTCRRCHMPEPVMYLDKEAFERHMNEPTQPAPETGVPLPSLEERARTAVIRSSIGADNWNYACQGLTTGDVKELLETLTQLRADLSASRDTVLAIAGLVNAYHNDGTTRTAAETLKAIAEALGKPFAALSGETREETT